MKKVLWAIPILLILLFAAACSQSDDAVDSNHSAAITSYLEVGTGAKLSDSVTVTKTGEALTVAPDDQPLEISGYTYLFSSLDRETVVAMGSRLKVNKYYIKSDQLVTDGALLIVRRFETDTGDEISVPTAISQKETITVSSKDLKGDFRHYGYIAGDLPEGTTVEPGKTATVNLYYKKSDGGAGTFAAVMVRYLEDGSEKPLSRPLVVTGVKALTVKNSEHQIEIADFKYVESSAAEVAAQPGQVGELIHYYRSSAAAATATVTVSYLEAGTDKALAPDDVITQVGSNLVVDAASHMKQIDGYNYASASAESVTVFPGETQNIKLYYSVAPVTQTASVTVNYYLEGTAKQIAKSQTVSSEGKAVSVSVSKYIKSISGYAYVSANPTGTVTASPGQAVQVAVYYRASSGSANVQPAPAALYPNAPGTQVFNAEKGFLDFSNTSEGYVMARFAGDSSKRSKLQITKDGTTYTYDLDSGGAMGVFPLNMGNGTYAIKIYEQISGTSYATVLSTTVAATLRNGLVPYLYPNQIVNYSAGSAAVAKARQLCSGAANDLERLKAIYGYITSHIKYDTAKAASVQSGYIPNVDSTLASNTGICYDYAALMAAMLRSQGIATRLIMGYVAPNGTYHAWNEVYLQNAGWVTVNIYANAGGYKLLDPTFGASMSDSAMANFLANSGNYSVKYRY